MTEDDSMGSFTELDRIWEAVNCTKLTLEFCNQLNQKNLIAESEYQELMCDQVC